MQSFPRLANAVPDQFASAARQLAAADADADGLVTEHEWMACTLWFEVGKKLPGCGDDLEAGHALMHESLSQEHFDEATALKSLLWTMFHEVRKSRTRST